MHQSLAKHKKMIYRGLLNPAQSFPLPQEVLMMHIPAF